MWVADSDSHNPGKCHFSVVGIIQAGFLFRLVDAAGIIMGLAGAFLGVEYATS
jgi:hypothetical protein